LRQKKIWSPCQMRNCTGYIRHNFVIDIVNM
jgi:hypothetical protein